MPACVLYEVPPSHMFHRLLACLLACLLTLPCCCSDGVDLVEPNPSPPLLSPSLPFPSQVATFPAPVSSLLRRRPSCDAPSLQAPPRLSHPFTPEFIPASPRSDRGTQAVSLLVTRVSVLRGVSKRADAETVPIYGVHRGTETGRPHARAHSGGDSARAKAFPLTWRSPTREPREREPFFAVELSWSLLDRHLISKVAKISLSLVDDDAVSASEVRCEGLVVEMCLPYTTYTIPSTPFRPPGASVQQPALG